MKSMERFMGKNGERTTTIFFIVALLVLGGLIVSGKGDFVGRPQSGGSQSWYAVHLNDGQIFFGHITVLSDSTITLTDAHFLESYDEPLETAVSKSFALAPVPKRSVRLVRRGDEKALSSDHTLFVNRASVIYWEKLAPESEVAGLLKEAK